MSDTEWSGRTLITITSIPDDGSEVFIANISFVAMPQGATYLRQHATGLGKTPGQAACRAVINLFRERKRKAPSPL